MRGSLRLSVLRTCVGRHFEESRGNISGAAFRCLNGLWSPSGNAAAAAWGGWPREVQDCWCWPSHFRGYSKSTKKDAKRMYVRNEDITAPELRVVMQDGTHQVMSRGEALEYVHTHKLDLVLVTADAVPPVAKVMVFSKFKYSRQQAEKKIASATRSREKLGAPKEVRVRPRISDHDLQQKLKKVSEFLGKGFRVTVAVLFKGDQEQKMAAEALHYIVKMVQEHESVEVLTAPDSASRRNSIAALISPAPAKDASSETPEQPKDGVMPPPPPTGGPAASMPPADPSVVNAHMKAE